MKTSNLLLILIVIFCFSACLKEEIDLDNLSTEVAIEQSRVLPLIYGSLKIEDFTDEGYDSLIIFGQDTFKLYIIEDLEYSDTISLRELGENFDFEYLHLLHHFTNYLPLSLDVQFYLFDSIYMQNLDTIFLIEDPDTIFLDAADRDEDGFVIEEGVVEQNGVVSLEGEQMDLLEEDATHIILDAVVPSTGDWVIILDRYSLDFRIGVDFSGRYITDLDSI